MISMLITILVYVIILAVLWYAFEYAITNLPITDPPARYIRILVVVIFCLIIVSLLLSLIGVGGFDLPRLR